LPRLESCPLWIWLWSPCFLESKKCHLSQRY
jgi:hypothetical protein